MDEVDFRQYLIRITFINWLVNLFIRNPELFTNRDLMDELAELMWSDTCALDGCDNSLLGYMVTAFFCCPKHATKAYRQSPEYKAYRQSPEYKANMKAYDKARAQTPERKASQKAIMKAYNQTPQRKASNKAYNKAYKQTSEYKAYQKVYNKAYYARKKAEAKLLTPS